MTPSAYRFPVHNVPASVQAGHNIADHALSWYYHGLCSVNNQYNDAANTWTAKANCTGNRNTAYIAEFQGRPLLTGGGSTTVCESFYEEFNLWVIKQSSLNPLYSGGAGITMSNGMFRTANDSSPYNGSEKHTDSVKNAILGAALEIK